MMIIITIAAAVVIFIIGAVLVAAGLPGLPSNLGYTNQGKTGWGRVISGLVLCILAVPVFLASFGWQQVSSGEVGVVSVWNKVQDDEMQPGLAWRVPIVSGVTTWDTKVQTYQFDKIEAFTSENQPALLSGIVNYHIVPEKASDLQVTFGQDYASKLIKSQADSALKAEARKYTVDLITAKRDELAAAAVAELTANNQNYGVIIDGVSIRNVDLSADYLAAVEAKQKAEQDAERAKAEAQTARNKAQGEADAQVIRAQGEADANAKIAASITQPLIQWEYIRKLAPNVTVMMVPENQQFIYPMPTAQP